MTTTPYNDNELSFNQCKAQKYKALSIALSAECTMLQYTLNLPDKYGEKPSDKLFDMIKELHSAIISLQYETFTPTRTVEQIAPPPNPSTTDEEIPF